jgi:hypothetical protein
VRVPRPAAGEWIGCSALGPLSAKLTELKALDLVGIPGNSEKEGGGANVSKLLPDHDEEDGVSEPVVASSAMVKRTGRIVAAPRRSK